MTTSVFRQSCLALACLFILNLSNLPVATGQIADEIRSHILFDIRLDKIRTWAESQDLNIDEAIFEMTGEQLPMEVIASLSRVFGTAQLPADMETAMAAGQVFGMGPGGGPPEAWNPEEIPGDYKKEAFDGDQKEKKSLDDFNNVSVRKVIRQEETDLPINFFVRFQFRDAAGAEAFSTVALSQAAERVIDGKTYLGKPPEEFGPGNIIAHLIADENTVEFGTIDYVTSDSRRLFTPNLADAFGKMPDDAIRLAVDMEGVSDMVDQVVMMAREEAPPAMGGMLDLVAKISSLQLSLDPQSDNLVSLVFNGKDKTGAEELRSGIDGLLALGKMASGQMTQELDNVSPEGGKAVGEILNSLKATRDGTQVSIVIPKPEGFDEAVKASVAAMRAAAAEMDEVNRLREVVLAVHNYHDAYKRLPFKPGNGMSENLSWRARVSPFTEGPQLDLQKGFDDPANSEFADQMPICLGDDGSISNVSWIESDDAIRLEGITDGTSNTIMLIQNPNGTPWMQPGGDLTIDQAVELITGIREGETLIVGFYDGSCRRLPAGISADDIRPFLTPRGGEAPNYEALFGN